MDRSKIKKIIRQSSFSVAEGRYIYAKARTVDVLDDHFMVSRDSHEITVVTREENVSRFDLIEKNKEFYKLIALNVSAPFYAVGFLSTVSTAIAEKGMNVLIVSTYSKDYLLVKYDNVEAAQKVLVKLGFKAA